MKLWELMLAATGFILFAAILGIITMIGIIYVVQNLV